MVCWFEWPIKNYLSHEKDGLIIIIIIYIEMHFIKRAACN